jgi:alkanesulfonate monooxygenase SsuD/methylene tetrahydromethanopterin reductase-like flavin-dependent oxidoreductase (luciferase family)
MRVGIKTNPQNTTWPDHLAVWRAADHDDSIESAWVFDHFYPIFSDPSGPCLEGWTVLAALAHDTDRLASAAGAGVELAIVNLPTPHDPGHVDVVGRIARSIG